MIKEFPPLPEVTQLENRREKNADLIDPAILQSADFLHSPEVVELLEMKEKIGLLGGKLNPVELVTIDNVAAQKARFLDVFGTNDESGVVFSYEAVKDKAQAALKEGLVALGHKDEDVGNMSLQEMVAEAGAQTTLLRDQGRENRRSIRSSLKANPQLHETDHAKHILRSKLAANIAMQGLVVDLESTLQLVQGISQNDDTQIAEALGQIYGRSISSELRAAADQYLLEVPKNAHNRFVGDGTSGLTSDEFEALVLAENKTIPSTAKGVEELQLMRKTDDPRSLLYADSTDIKKAFVWTTEKLYGEYEERTGAAFPEDQKFSFAIGDYSSIDVRDKSSGGKVICIPQNRIVDLKSLYELIIHEIESHVLQSYLSDVVVGLGGGMTKPNQEIVYEGLALTREDEGSREFLGIESKLSENKAYYILAMDEALKGKSFWEVAHVIYDQSLELLKKRGIDDDAIERQAKEKAWTIAYRVFRGHQKLDGFDTETAYAFTKDEAYLHGLLLVSQLNEREMGNIAAVAISHINALSLLARFDFSDDKMPITFQRHADEYFSNFLHPSLKEYVERTKAS
ncbi:MAG: flavohemoglobin expression-modulating QEGLA motif protein [bacterium]|nr:flavohemoglobin expression-modulating QEGLA motif protein [bacterium]